MQVPGRQLLDPDRFLRLTELSADEFESLLLGFLRSRPLLTVSRDGKAISARVTEATTYARRGRLQHGIDVRAKMEGGEIWVFQCKRVRSWNRSETAKAIADATFVANHYVLVLACNPPAGVHDEIAKHAKWTLWNLDTICTEIRRATPPETLPRILSFLSPDELKRFTPFASAALVTRQEFFAARMGTQRLFRHDWDLVGRRGELTQLETLLKPDGKRGVVLYSKGGDGKSRLLLEFARGAEKRGVPVRFLNPNGSTDDLESSFLRDDPQFVVVVDDAHRPDPRYDQLLRLAEQDKRARLLFATRPQGFAPLLSRLVETGLREQFVELNLSPLRTSEIRSLSEQALGAEKKGLAAGLVHFTNDSPFLTVLAGELIRLGKLALGGWASDKDFRVRVFKAFEEENLHDLPPEQKTLSARLLRVIAVLAPTNLDDCFSDRSAKALGSEALDVDDEIQRLRRFQLLTDRGAVGRIIPDLFADFLAYDVAVDPEHRQLPLLNAVRREFPEAVSTMLRNLAEASWVGGPPTSDVDAMLAPLVADEFQRFRALSFRHRAEFLSAWGGFGIYLPRQTLELARIALTERTAPEHVPGPMEKIFSINPESDSHREVIERLPALVEPIALYHHDHLVDALDLLWEVGKLKSLSRFLHLGSHAWETIGKVLSLQEGKPISFSLAGLNWLAGKLRTPAGCTLVSENVGLLASLLDGCFVRFVEFRGRRGLTLSYWEAPVDQTRTASIRKRAFEILTGVIEQADWKAAIGVLGALEKVLRRIAKHQQWVDDVDAFRVAWRADRLSGLEVLRNVVSKHPEPAIRYLAWAQLKRLTRYEEDPAFREKCSEAIDSIPDDLALRMSRALSAQGGLEEVDDGEPSETAEGREASSDRWEVARGRIFDEFRHAHSDPATMLARLTELDAHLAVAGCHTWVWPFFSHLGRHDPAAAEFFATRLVEISPQSNLAKSWPTLIGSHAYGTGPLLALTRRALNQPDTQASYAALSFLINRRDQEPSLTDEERALVLASADRAQPGEVRIFLQALEFPRPKFATLGREIITRMSFVASPEAERSVLRIVAAYCARDGSDAALVRTLLGKVISMTALDPSNDPEAWHLLTTEYPWELLEFFRARVELEESGQAPEGFRALSTFRPIWLDAPKLHTKPDFERLREDVWQRAIGNGPHANLWLHLLHMFGPSDVAWLESKLVPEINAAMTIERLERVTRFLSFRGSLMVLRRPDLTRRLLVRARELSGSKSIREALYVATDPQTAMSITARLENGDDYLEAEALKAAEANADDPELHPFFRWMVERVQAHKRWVHSDHELRMRALED